MCAPVKTLRATPTMQTPRAYIGYARNQLRVVSRSACVLTSSPGSLLPPEMNARKGSLGTRLHVCPSENIAGDTHLAFQNNYGTLEQVLYGQLARLSFRAVRVWFRDYDSRLVLRTLRAGDLSTWIAAPTYVLALAHVMRPD